MTLDQMSPVAVAHDLGESWMSRFARSDHGCPRLPILGVPDCPSPLPQRLRHAAYDAPLDSATTAAARRRVGVPLSPPRIALCPHFRSVSGSQKPESASVRSSGLCPLTSLAAYRGRPAHATGQAHAAGRRDASRIRAVHTQVRCGPQRGPGPRLSV